MPNKAPKPPKAKAKNSNVNSEIRSYPFIADNLSYPKDNKIPYGHNNQKIRFTHNPIFISP